MVSQHARLEHATQHLDAPLAVVDLDAFDANAADLARRAGGTPIRVASKSVRCRALLQRVLDQEGYAGVLAFTLAEALWLADGMDVEDVVVGYPTAERAALRRLAADPVLLERVTLMVDSVESLDLVRATVAQVEQPIRICLDLDASLRYLDGRVHLGPRRSPVHSVGEAVALARAVAADPVFTLVGVMAYEGQVAGLQDRPAGGVASTLRGLAVRRLKRASVAELTERRGAVVAAVREVADLELVNGGGTGSIETTVADPSVTEVAAGSGLLAPALFDGYDSFTPAPAALFALAVTRRPGPGLVTVAGGGWIASGPAGPDRLPVPTYPVGLGLLGAEGAGEVQTPLRGAAADDLAIGDRVWFRHAKAGELGERVADFHLVAGDEVVDVVPTYRGEGLTFV
ncbi:amino acid deaminase/aldolase [Nocardioides sp.]|uniref:amino acid deaminase/aldolase n=1 Tax=Nocardioides sp. TaxID=35761 RepID=UPI0027215CF5|nr:amino acid deaminase/aldolase [Nocardioides sp.]MDO9455026.1 amino acid deaminase/aldolase [Nocardioides sp.]